MYLDRMGKFLLQKIADCNKHLNNEDDIFPTFPAFLALYVWIEKAFLVYPGNS